MIGPAQATPLRAHVSDDHFGRRAGHPKDRLQQAHGGFKGGLISWIGISTRAIVSSRLSI
jgi:hypothetical protein